MDILTLAVEVATSDRFRNFQPTDNLDKLPLIRDIRRELRLPIWADKVASIPPPDAVSDSGFSLSVPGNEFRVARAVYELLWVAP